MGLSVEPAGAPAQGAAVDNKTSKTAAAAREFEAILLQDWLEKMNETFVGVEKSSDPAQGTINSLAAQTIATAVANRGGIGIAALVLKHLGHETGPEAGGAPRRQLPQVPRIEMPRQARKGP
jgi:peptidoglycan hydrolase FlgJ